MAVAIVDGALFGVREHGVGFANLFEFFFGVGIIRIAVGMILQRKLAVGTFQLLLGTGAADAENLVVIAFFVLRRNGLSPQRLKPLCSCAVRRDCSRALPGRASFKSFWFGAPNYISTSSSPLSPLLDAAGGLCICNRAVVLR